MVRVSWVLALVLLGCGPPTPQVAKAPVPTELRRWVTLASSLGREVHLHDRAAAQATDLLLADKAKVDPRVRGFVTFSATDGMRTSFAAEIDGVVVQFHEVVAAEGVAPKLTHHVPPQPLDAQRASKFRAMQTASAAKCQPTERPRNPVVLPAERLNGKGWLVWLLVTTTDPHEVPLAGHCRVHVTDDGRSIVETTPLSKTVLIARIGPDTKALVVTHFGATPDETHVATSLTYRMPLAVLTGKTGWTVEGDRIEYFTPP